MSTQLTIDPQLDFAIERFIDAPTRLVWEALTKPEHLKEWYMPKPWGRVTRAELDVRPGGIIRIDIAVGDGQDSPNVGCVLEVVPMKNAAWRSLVFAPLFLAGCDVRVDDNGLSLNMGRHEARDQQGGCDNRNARALGCRNAMRRPLVGLGQCIPKKERPDRPRHGRRKQARGNDGNDREE